MRSLPPTLSAAARRLSSSAAGATPKPSNSLTEEELAEVRRLVPRLLAGGHHADAVRLLAACLLPSTPPTPAALPLPAFADAVSSLPDPAPAFDLLAALRHHPRRPSPIPFCRPLLSAFLRRRRPKEAFKIFSWLLRPDSSCRPDAELYRIALKGFCGLGRMLEALKVVKEMVGDGIALGPDLRELVYRGMLREARIDEARELDATLKLCEENSGGFGASMELLDRMIKDWEE